MQFLFSIRLLGDALMGVALILFLVNLITEKRGVARAATFLGALAFAAWAIWDIGHRSFIYTAGDIFFVAFFLWSGRGGSVRALVDKHRPKVDAMQSADSAARLKMVIGPAGYEAIRRVIERAVAYLALFLIGLVYGAWLNSQTGWGPLRIAALAWIVATFIDWRCERTKAVRDEL